MTTGKQALDHLEEVASHELAAARACLKDAHFWMAQRVSKVESCLKEGIEAGGSSSTCTEGFLPS